MSSEVCELLERARRYGDWVEIEEVLIEDLDPVRDWDDYRALLHRDIPQALRKVLGECAEILGLYHLKDELCLPEYVAELSFSGNVYTAELDVCVDAEVSEVTLLAVRLTPGLAPAGLLAHYHAV